MTKSVRIHSIFIITILIIVLCNCATTQTDSSSSSKVKENANSVTREQFYGVWRINMGDYSIVINLSKESWEASYPEGIYFGSYYTIDQLTWVPVENEDPATKDQYPMGYYITGTVSQMYNSTTGLRKIGAFIQGQQYTYIIYLKKDKAAFLRKETNNTTTYVFTKFE